MVIISLLLALAGAAPPEGQHATLQACEMTPGGWGCRYTIPAVTLMGAANAPPPTVPLAPTAQTSPPTPAMPSNTEAARQARLIANCADAGWISLCLPKDRREARRLRDAAIASASGGRSSMPGHSPGLRSLMMPQLLLTRDKFA